jgi:tetratricopeptide (TPR) repeat protein
MRNKNKIENINLIVILVIVLLVPAYLIKVRIDTAKKFNLEIIDEKFVGKEACIECHSPQYELWKGSHHDLAMDYANDSTVLGDFNNAELIAKGNTHKFYKRDKKFFVFTVGETGEMHEFEVKYTFGYTPLQQYMVELDKGRVQVLALTWNTLDSTWYHMADSVYADENVDYKNWLHWTNQSQNWNSMCADCHSTNLKKGYDLNTDSYNTTWSEIDVSCEACHGPSSKHIEWANLPLFSRSGFENYGLVVKTSDVNNKEYVDLCARCHSRRSAITDFTMESKSIFEHMIPNLPTEPNYHIDGQILEEDYVYGSFTQSKMYMQDVKCNDCHEVHSGNRLFDDNRLCSQCHIADKYDTKEHHFHKSIGETGVAVISEAGVKFDVGEGAKCINCHMHAQYFMGVDYRNDHSFRIPRPDLSEELGTPNACNQCHNDKSNQWAQSYIETWYGKSRHYQYGEAFALARAGNPEGFLRLETIVYDDLYPEIIRSTAVEFIGAVYPDSSKTILLEMMLNINPQIRYSAVRNYVLDNENAILNILPLIYDEVKAIRIECARKLMAVSNDQIPEKYKNVLQEVTAEYLETIEYNADFPIGKLNLANYYYSKQDLQQAEKFYLAALKQDEELHEIKINLAYLYNAMGKTDKTEILFKDYLKNRPNDGVALFSYALLLSELKRYEESLELMLKANKVEFENARIDYNIAMMYDFFGDKIKAEKFLKQAIEKQKNDITYYSVLLNFYIQNKDQVKIKDFAKLILEKFPDLENRAQIEALIN